MASNDPDFETKAADIIGLYLDPPRHISALGRRDRVLPLSPGRVERHGFEYSRSMTAATDPLASRDPRVTLSTLHGAKGLEFDTVVVPAGVAELDEPPEKLQQPVHDPVLSACWRLSLNTNLPQEGRI